MACFIKKSSLIIFTLLVFSGCDAFDKQLYLNVPGLIKEVDYGIEFPGSVTVRHSVPESDENSSSISIQLEISDNGIGRFYLNPGGLVIEEGESTAVFTITPIDDDIAGNDVTASITASASGYDSDTVNINVISEE